MPSEKEIRHFIYESEEGMRLDAYLASVSPDKSRSRIKKEIINGLAAVNGETERSAHRILKKGERIELVIKEEQREIAPDATIELSVLYEDDHILVINKQAGIAVHPGAGLREGSIVHALKARYENFNIGDAERPGIVHRLDKVTTGAMIVAKTEIALRNLIHQFKTRQVFKEYRVVVKGSVDWDEIKLDTRIGRHPVRRKKLAVLKEGGKRASTRFKVLSRIRELTYLSAYPETGRTHQIRVHLSHSGHPVLGDEVYGGRGKKGFFNKELSKLRKAGGIALHAYGLSFIHPESHKRVEFRACFPAYFVDILRLFNNEKGE